ncbi:hypothetical protein OK074_7794 [Actinobacteria bacterium OK074]|nr:hypothetical protein OK074_7794 [Actinobacteria bacterium OK074]
MRLKLVLASALLAVLAAGCADPAADPRAAGGSSASPKGYCPQPEESGTSASTSSAASPSPCISSDWNARVAENHAYRQPMDITAEQKAAAQPKADALAKALKKLAADGTTETGLRAAAAKALGLRAAEIEVQGDEFDPLHDVLVGGGRGKVCVNGTVASTGDATAEVIGRTADGTCLPGLGGH